MSTKTSSQLTAIIDLCGPNTENIGKIDAKFLQVKIVHKFTSNTSYERAKYFTVTYVEFEFLVSYRDITCLRNKSNKGF